MQHATGCNRITNPANPAVSIVEMMRYLRTLGSDTAALTPLVTDLINEAVEWLENETRQVFITQQWEYVIDQFPYYIANRVVPFDYKHSALILPMNPVQNIVSITYTDSTNTPNQTLTDFQLSNKQWPARVLPAPGNVWPFAYPYAVDTVRIVFNAGYGDTDDKLPFLVKRAVKLLVTHMVENDLPVVTGTIATEIPHTLTKAINSLRYRGFVA